MPYNKLLLTSLALYVGYKEISDLGLFVKKDLGLIFNLCTVLAFPLPEIWDILRPRYVSGKSLHNGSEYKMATRSAGKGAVPYSVLNNLSSVDILYDENKKRRRRRIAGVFDAERLITQRKDKKVNNCLFVLKI
jgi:hypothetical protein